MTTTPETITQKVAADYSWVKTHLILLALVVILTIGSVYGVESLIAKHEAAQSQQWTSIAQTLEKNNESVQSQNQSTIATLAQQNSVLQQQVSSLLLSVSTRDANLKQQQVLLPKLTPTALSSKWGDVANEPAPAIDSTGNFQVPLPLALKSTQALIAVPVLTADVADEKSTIAKQVQQLSNDSTAFASEQSAHKSDNETCTADKKALNGQIATVKADARKSKFKWFLIGGLLGLIGGHFI